MFALIILLTGLFANAEVQPIQHDGQVMGVAISPDGRLVASVGLYDGLRISDSQGKLVRFIASKKQGTGFRSVAFTPSGKEIVVGGESEIFVFEAETGKQQRNWEVQDRGIRGLAISPDGKTVATRGDRERRVRLWDLATGKLTTTLEGHNDLQFPTLRWAGPDRLLLSTFSGVSAWDVNKGELLFRLPGSTGGGLAVAPKQDTFVTGGEKADHHVSLRDVGTGKEILAFKGGSSIPYAYSFRPDGKSVASGDQGGTVRVFDVATGDILSTWKVDGIIRSMAYSADGDLLAVATARGSVWLLRPDR